VLDKEITKFKSTKIDGFIFAQLASCLLGDTSAVTDWEPVLAFANDSLLTPAIWSSMLERKQQHMLPPDVASFLAYIHHCNVERNKRLRAQLYELVGALNACGITPTLTKGAALLSREKAEQPISRIMRDLDVTVAEEERHIAEGCLRQLGYAPIEALGWGRSKDVGAVDLHFPPGRYPQYWPSPSLAERHRRDVDLGGGKAYVFSATLQAQHWIVHDMLKDGHLWNLHIDLRNLFELYRLSTGDSAIDWRELSVLLSDPLGRAMLAAQRLALASVFATDLVPNKTVPAWLKLHHYLRRNEYHRQLGPVVQSVGSAAWAMRVAQIQWRFRGPWRELPARFIRKGQRVLATGRSKEI